MQCNNLDLYHVNVYVKDHLARRGNRAPLAPGGGMV